MHRSDQGCQHTALAFGQRLQRAGIVASMGNVGGGYDNAVTESLFATLKGELLYRSFDGRMANARGGAAVHLRVHRGVV